MSSKLITERNSKKEQNFISLVSYFLSQQDSLKTSIVNLKSTKYSFSTNTLSIGYTTIDGKYGTVKQKLTKLARPLSDYMFSRNIFPKAPLIAFKVQKEDEQVEKVKNLLEKLDQLDKEQQSPDK
jgi:hypothetical protein